MPSADRGHAIEGWPLVVSVEAHRRTNCSIQTFGAAKPSQPPSCAALVEDGRAILDFGPSGLPQYLLIGLLLRDGTLLDEREIGFAWGRGPRDLVVDRETRELVIRQWIELGESNTIEFKEGVRPKDYEKATDLLETVVAFANSAGGTIILGVNDHGDPIGFRRDDFGDVIHGMLQQRCDPVPTIELEQVDLDGTPLTLLHVPAGQSGVLYALDRTKFYVRAGGTDRLARSEQVAARLAPSGNIVAGLPVTPGFAAQQII